MTLQALNHYDFIIIGAGLAGCVAARELTDAGATCLVVDRRDHIGGNCYSHDVGKIEVHNYGPHIFHTNKIKLWEYINRFSEWKTYYHQVKSMAGDKLYDFPPNLNVLKEMFSTTEITKDIKSALWLKFYYGYTLKAWGGNDAPFDPIKRIPIKKTTDNNYWNDLYQGLPIRGYSDWFECLISDVDTAVGVSLDPAFMRRLGKRLIYSGRIDNLIDLASGKKLQFRGVKFKTRLLPVESLQKIASINYADAKRVALRRMEWKYFTNDIPVKTPYTVVTIERFDKNGSDYPYIDQKNMQVYKEYRNETDDLNITMIGRAGLYNYMNMDETIESTLKITEKMKS